MPDTPSDPAPGAGSIGRYRVEQEIGRGAMGVVYKAHDPEIDRPVAIKLVRFDLLETQHRDDYLARFRREVQAAGRCQHPNIVAIYDFGSHSGDPYFVMEYVDAKPLDQVLPKGAGLGAEAASDIILQLLEALASAHALGIVHRDVKPGNMLLAAGRRIKVMDFGISRISTSHLTQAGAVMGTPRYMSPEQIRGDEVDARSDLFSTGAVLHELLTGRTPFTGGFEQVMAKLLYDPPDIAPADAMFPEALRAVVAKAISKPPEDRFQTAEEMSAAIREAMGTPPRQVTAVQLTSTPAAAPAPPQAAAARLGDDPTLRDAALLGAIEQRLAQYMGPIAGRLVRNALRVSASPEALCQALAESIDQPGERDRFVADVHKLLQRAAPAGAPGAARAAGPALSAEEIVKVEQDLTYYLGPIAKVLVRRAASTVTTSSGLRQALAEHLEQPAERSNFLAGG
ncbi:MAG TPA: serine/threonine-protein kinase [Caulobacteraceae bacterium]|jgi:serine/threonine-protein kinase